MILCSFVLLAPVPFAVLNVNARVLRGNVRASEFIGHIYLMPPALLHWNARAQAAPDERLGLRLIPHYCRIMFLPGAYKSTEPGRFHVHGGSLSCISTGPLNSTCIFYISVGVDAMGRRVCVYRSVTGLMRRWDQTVRQWCAARERDNDVRDVWGTNYNKHHHKPKRWDGTSARSKCSNLV